MAGRVLSRKEEGGNLWQQPVIAQGHFRCGGPCNIGASIRIHSSSQAANPAPLEFGRQALLEV